MKEQLILFETAKLAKEKGFKEECSSHIDEFNDNEGHRHIITNHVHAGYRQPTQSLLQKWLREKHNVDIIIYVLTKGMDNVWSGYMVALIYYCKIQKSFSKFKTYEEALEKGLKEALNLI